MRVYISSTSLDLEHYRAAVRTAVLRLGHHPICMEDYVAGDVWPAEKCLADVASCNAYVGIFAWRYGCVPPDCQASITEMELRKAQEKGISVLAFLLDEKEKWPTEYCDTGLAGEKIAALRRELLRDKLTSFFTNPDDLCAVVTASLANLGGDRETVVNPPFADPHDFRDRVEPAEELRTILLKSEAKLICVVGRRDVGKTWLVSKVAHEIERGELRLSETPSQVGANGIIYISCLPTRPTLSRVFDYVGRVLGSPHREDLQKCWADTSKSCAEKVVTLLGKLQDGCYLLFFDNFEVMLTADQNHIADPDLRLFFEEALVRPNALRILTNGQRVPIFAPELEGRLGHELRKLSLSQGLPEEEAIAVLRELGGESQLRSASDEQLLDVARRCGCLPGVLAKFVGIVKQNPVEPLSHFLQNPELLTRLTEDPSRLIYEHLSAEKRLVLQALAVYGRRVEAGALEVALPELGETLKELLNELVLSYVVELSYAPASDSESPVAGMSPLFSLASADARYAHSQIPTQSHRVLRLPWASSGPPCLRTLHLRAAAYERSLARHPDECRSREDLEPQLREFDHLVKAADYDGAYRLLERFAFPRLWLWGQHDEVVELHEMVVSHLRDPELQHLCRANLGLAHLSVLRPAEAIESLDHAIRLAVLRKDRQHLSQYLGNLALAHELLGEFDKSCDLLKRSLVIDRDLGDGLTQGTHLGDLAAIYCSTGQMAEARRCCEQGLSLSRQNRDQRVEANQVALLGLLHLLQGEVGEAEACFETGAKVAAEANSAAGLFHNHSRLAYCRLQRGNAGGAVEESMKAHQFSPPGLRHRAALILGVAYVSVSTIGAGRGSWEDCLRRCDCLLDRDERLVGPRYVRATVLLCLGRTDEAMGEFRRARERCSTAGILALLREDLRLINGVLPTLEGLAEAEEWLEVAIQSAPQAQT